MPFQDAKKVTFDYQNRPGFRMEEHLVSEEMRKNMLLVQYQILFGG